MNVHLTHFASVLVICVSTCPGAHAAADEPGSKIQAIRNVRKLLSHHIETAPLQEEMPLEKFLAAVVRQFPKDDKIALRIDKEAFGKDYTALARSPIQFQPFPKRMQLGTALRLALSKSEIPATYRLDTDAIVITTPERSLFTLTYDVGDILDLWDSRGWDYKKLRGLGASLDLADEKSLGRATPLVRMILGSVDPESWSLGKATHGNLKVVNETWLVIHATADRHGQVDSLLESLRRLADLAVVMNARVVEVDRLFYAQHIRPLLVEPRGSVRNIVAIDKPLEAALNEQRLIVKDNNVKLFDRLERTVLSVQQAVAYTAERADATKEADAVQRIAVEGFAIAALAKVDDTRFRLRLTITQRIAQLLEVKKTATIDPGTGKTVAVESPNVRQATVSGSVNIDDGQAIVMPLQSTPKEKDRVLVLVARPTIYIEEEEALLKEAAKPEARKEPGPKQTPKPKPEESSKKPAGQFEQETWKTRSESGRKALFEGRYADAEREFGAAL